ncbi:MAG: apolipoprotein N-acyltransferase, partial [Pseudomonadota bacterium]
PWPPLGLMLLGGWDTPGVARLLPWMGTYALSGLTLLLAAGLAAMLQRRSFAACAVGVAMLTLVMLVPSLASRAPSSDDGVRYRLVQPLIKQDEINDGSKFEEQFQRLSRLSQPGFESRRIVFWPESAIPDYLEEGYPERYYRRMTAGGDPAFARARIADVIGEQSVLLTGVINLDIGVVDGRRKAVSARNSVVALTGDPSRKGAITHTYDKAHLVPYGEYLPIREWLEPLGFARLVAGSIDYRQGPGPRTFDLGEHGQVGVQTCYEIVFSGQVVDPSNRPDYIFNASIDGWFGSWGPPQHLAQARMRAIEEGLPVLRSTTTGISAVIDARGVVLQSIAMNEAGALTGLIPAAANPTLFAKLGNALPLIWAAVLIMLGLGVPRLLALQARRG